MCAKFWLARLAVDSSMRENARNDSTSVESACSSKSPTNRSSSVSPCSSAWVLGATRVSGLAGPHGRTIAPHWALSG